ncbi:MAG: mechanosensitive ion channel family protein [Candidatus Fusobacterium pullicola]|uniref:Mechanosensitive ion channel family protein n=1 Tax=Candidatus Fusobacterium pullicola TaxID=2838601 RepID=A0A9E2KY63_9FUSO|nr:mechanosensitive ion channel family protein [Fusobacterium mortiferum]MBU3841836.1 mechanosensitive ion channel family protein [Candidatus Fusobacterium pullicola]
MLEHTYLFINELFKKIFGKQVLLNFFADFIIFMMKLIACVLIYYIATRIIKKLSPVLSKNKEEIIRNQSLKSFIKSILNIGIHLFLITICLLILGIKGSSLVAFFGTLGIGVGLALKDNLSNLAAGIIILVFKAYKVGDEVNINEEVGFIYEIDVFSTSIRTYNGDLIIVPNGVIISNKIINYTKIPIRRLKFVIRVSYDCNLKIARESLEKLLKDNPLVIDDPPIVSHVESYEEGFINIALKGWTKNENYWQVYWEVMNNLKDYLAENNIKLPTNKMDITINQNSSNTTPQ